MPFQRRILELSEKLAVSQDDQQSIDIAHELQELLHKQIEHCRQRIRNLFPIVQRNAKPVGGNDSLRLLSERKE
jgi:hypothetical protein